MEDNEFDCGRIGVPLGLIEKNKKEPNLKEIHYFAGNNLIYSFPTKKHPVVPGSSRGWVEINGKSQHFCFMTNGELVTGYTGNIIKLEIGYLDNQTGVMTFAFNQKTGPIKFVINYKHAKQN